MEKRGVRESADLIQRTHYVLGGVQPAIDVLEERTVTFPFSRDIRQTRQPQL